MLFSSFPFAPLPAAGFRADPDRLAARSDGSVWNDVAFTEYRVCTNDSFDCFANKGAGLVTVRHPGTGRAFHIVFTHLQAGQQDTSTEARTEQFAQVSEMILATLPPDPATHNVIMMGDLNVHGDLSNTYRIDPFTAGPPGRPEWDRVFGDPGSFYRSAVRDSWEFETHDPDGVTPQRRDRGASSSVDRPVDRGERDRLDYVLRNDALEPLTNSPLCYQHLTLARNLSMDGPIGLGGVAGVVAEDHLGDHIGVNADINYRAPFCSSRTPRVIVAGDFDRPTGTALFADVAAPLFHIRYPGGMQWFRIDEPGTYSFEIAGESLPRLDVYASTDMSTPLLPYGGGETTTFLDPSGQRRTGLMYHLRAAPIYLRVTLPDRLLTGSYRLAIHRHQCSSFEDRCVLLPNLASPPLQQVPTEAIGWDGLMYFVVDTDGPFDDGAQELHFSVEAVSPPVPGFSGGFAFGVMRGGPDCLAPDPPVSCVLASGASGPEPAVLAGDPSVNRTRLFMIVSPMDDAPPTFRAAWSTDLVVLHAWVGDGDDGRDATADTSEQGLTLTCGTQANQPQNINDDEDVRVQFYLNAMGIPPSPDGRPTGTPLFARSAPGAGPAFDLRPDLGDFDRGERRPLHADGHVSCPIGFLGDIKAELEAHGRRRTFFLRSAATSLTRSDERRLRVEFRVRDTDESVFNTGQYTFQFNLSHGTQELARDSARPVARPDGAVDYACTERRTRATVPMTRP
jgi:hypothetical protein